MADFLDIQSLTGFDQLHMYLICPLSVVPLRDKPSHSGELVSQMLFGEMAEVMEREGKKWVKIRCVWDETIAWVDLSQVKIIPTAEFDEFRRNFAFALDLFQPVFGKDFSYSVPLGGRLPLFDGLSCQLNGESLSYSGQAAAPQALFENVEMLLKIARRFLWAPAMNGGRTPMGIDSAGLVQLVFLLIGKRIPRAVENQVFFGEQVDFLEQVQAGDLAFFENSKGNIEHVGLFTSREELIHSHGFVRVDKIDHYGIFNESENKYTHRLRVIKRILPESNEAKPAQNQEEVEVLINQGILF